MNFRTLAALLTGIPLISGCSTMPGVDAQRMPPAALIRALGPPARIKFNETVFGWEGHWVKGAQEYRYYVVNSHGQMDCWRFYYKDQKWLTESPPLDVTRLRVLDLNRRKDKKRIESFEASRSWL